MSKDNLNRIALPEDCPERQQVYDLWIDTLEVCRQHIADVKAGDRALRASLLKEIVRFLESSEHIIERWQDVSKAAEVDAEEDLETDLDNVSDEEILKEVYKDLDMSLPGQGSAFTGQDAGDSPLLGDALTEKELHDIKDRL